MYYIFKNASNYHPEANNCTSIVYISKHVAHACMILAYTKAYIKDIN